LGYKGPRFQHYLSRVNDLGESKLAALKIQTDELCAERDEALSSHKALLASLDRDLKRDDEKFRKMTICSEQAIKVRACRRLPKRQM